MELLITLDGAPGTPMHVQLERRLRADVHAGRLAPETQLPSTRELSSQLGVSRGVVVEAYSQLVAEGYLTAQRGSGTRVASRARHRGDAPRVRERPARAAPRYDLHPGLPDIHSFPRAAWLASTRRALREAPAASFGYGPPRGARELREALAGHLGRVRGCVADPGRIVVCSGLIQGFGLAFRALRARGATRIAVEDPGWAGHRAVLEHSGLEAVGVGVDDGGIMVDAVVRADADAVLVTPAHQSPTGVVLTPERRATLLAWAQDRDALIIEDDYDAEYRYDREPVGALQGLAPEQVLYAGSASKVLAPALRIGWLLAPAWLSPLLAQEKAYADLGTPIVEQLTLADFVATGALDRHLRRMRRHYRSRRDALVAALAEHLPDVEVRGVAAGLHVLALAPSGVDERAWVDGARERGIAVHGLAEHGGAGLGRAGLVIGYAATPEPGLQRVVGELAAVYRELESRAAS